MPDFGKMRRIGFSSSLLRWSQKIYSIFLLLFCVFHLFFTVIVCYLSVHFFFISSSLRAVRSLQCAFLCNAFTTTVYLFSDCWTCKSIIHIEFICICHSFFLQCTKTISSSIHSKENIMLKPRVAWFIIHIIPIALF